MQKIMNEVLTSLETERNLWNNVVEAQSYNELEHGGTVIPGTLAAKDTNTSKNHAYKRKCDFLIEVEKQLKDSQFSWKICKTNEPNKMNLVIKITENQLISFSFFSDGENRGDLSIKWRKSQFTTGEICREIGKLLAE